MQRSDAVAVVTAEECSLIKELNSRRLALRELVSSLSSVPRHKRGEVGDRSSLYGQMVADLAETISAYESWWAAMSAKYKLNGVMEIDFATREIYPSRA